MKCLICGESVPPSARACPSCQADAGFPNVRAAAGIEEKSALEKRFRDAEISARARGCEEALRDFGTAVLYSKAVFCRNLNAVTALVSSDNALYSSFYRQLEGETRLPEDSPFDRARAAVDGTLFPHYHKDICFAALSLNHLGPSKFGDYTIVLKEKMILQRATVFEENSVSFCQVKHRIVVGDSIPAGYRAEWPMRDKLAMAKLHDKIDSGTRLEQYPGILLHDGPDPDFIEVHIWGPIHRSAIERVIGPKPKRGTDRVLLNSLERKLKELGAVLEIK